MGHWNYRVLHHHSASGAFEPYYALHEVFYGDDGKPNGFTEHPIDFVADDSEGADRIERGLGLALSDVKHRSVLKVVDGRFV